MPMICLMKYTCNTAIERFPKACPVAQRSTRFSSIRRLMRQLVNSLLRAMPLAVQPQWSTRVTAKLELPTHIASASQSSSGRMSSPGQKKTLLHPSLFSSGSVCCCFHRARPSKCRGPRSVLQFYAQEDGVAATGITAVHRLCRCNSCICFSVSQGCGSAMEQGKQGSQEVGGRDGGLRRPVSTLSAEEQPTTKAGTPATKL
jgi:hypothetical protein